MRTTSFGHDDSGGARSYQKRAEKGKNSRGACWKSAGGILSCLHGHYINFHGSALCLNLRIFCAKVDTFSSVGSKRNIAIYFRYENVRTTPDLGTETNFQI